MDTTKIRQEIRRVLSRHQLRDGKDKGVSCQCGSSFESPEQGLDHQALEVVRHLQIQDMFR